MYLPTSELQQYRGQWTCPYCIMDMRDEDRRMNEPKTQQYKKADHPLSVGSYEERCERCGKEMTTVYMLNGKRLCINCVHNEQDKWETVGGEKPSATPLKISVERRKKSLLGRMFERLFSELLGILGMRQKESAPMKKPVNWYARFGKPLVTNKGKERRSIMPTSDGLMRVPEPTEKEKPMVAVRIEKSRSETLDSMKKEPDIIPSQVKKLDSSYSHPRSKSLGLQTGKTYLDENIPVKKVAVPKIKSVKVKKVKPLIQGKKTVKDKKSKPKNQE